MIWEKKSNSFELLSSTLEKLESKLALEKKKTTTQFWEQSCFFCLFVFFEYIDYF